MANRPLLEPAGPLPDFEEILRSLRVLVDQMMRFQNIPVNNALDHNAILAALQNLNTRIEQRFAEVAAHARAAANPAQTNELRDTADRGTGETVDRNEIYQQWNAHAGPASGRLPGGGAIPADWFSKTMEKLSEIKDVGDRLLRAYQLPEDGTMEK